MMGEQIQWLVAAMVGITVGWFLRGRIAKGDGQNAQADKAALRRNVNEAEERYLEVLRREISNILLNVDPDLMVRTYEKGWRYQDELVTAGRERTSADLKALTLKHKSFSEFDLLGTRHFVPYSDARWSASDDELVERYLEISKMMLLPRLLDRDHSPFRLFTEEEFQILRKTERRCKDRTFKDHIVQAVARYYALQGAIDRYGSKEAREQRNSLDDIDIEVFRLPYDGAENELGIIFKKTGEYGVYGTFHHDDAKISESFYRSDTVFQKRDYLDAR
ncbi:hypothetical protein NKI25_08035 [Mesorhizobium sp. M0808]|uniref:hypothetical protein n=1 Tax=Mesorhizobium sp. M0808 TaxID=2957002 RepID=UPI003335B28E